MFQPWFLELVSLISDILVGISAIIVTFLGFWGLYQWRRELIGRTRFEVARKMAMLAFQLRDEFIQARNPSTFAHESAERKRLDNETIEETQIRDEYFARIQRLAPLLVTIGKLDELCWEAQIVIDEDIERFIIPLKGFVQELSSAIQVYFQWQITRSERTKTIEPRGMLEKSHSQIYGSPNDEISQKVDKAVKELTEELKNYFL